MLRRPLKTELSYSREALVENGRDVVNQLKHAQLFSGLSDVQLKEIADLSVVRSYGDQDVIFSQGDVASYLHVVATGNVALVKQMTRVTTGEEVQVTVDILRAGQSLCWGSLVQPNTYTLSARALGRVELVAIDSAKFDAWLQRSATAEMQVLKNLNIWLAQRLYRAYDALTV